MKNYEDYNNVSEFIEEVEAADYWNEIEAEVYERFLEDYGLDYGSYDDFESRQQMKKVGAKSPLKSKIGE